MRSSLACEALISNVALNERRFFRAIIANLWGLKGPWYEKPIHANMFDF